MLEGALIVVAALLIFREAFRHSSSRDARRAGPGLRSTALATAINAAVGWFLHQPRPPLALAGAGSATAGTSGRRDHLGRRAGGSALAAVTGGRVLDPLIAARSPLNILRFGWRLVRESVGGLMDEAASPRDPARIRT